MYHPSGAMKDLGVDGRMILKWTFRKLDGGTWSALIWFRTGPDGGLCENNNKVPVP